MKLFHLIVLVFVVAAGGPTYADRRATAIVDVINEEISEVNRLAKSVGGKNPNHFLRLAELYLEKARIVQDLENKRYLKVPPKQRNQARKRQYFKTSRKLYQTAQRYGKTIIQRYRRYSAKGDVYYILGYNAKELGRKKEAARYFNKAIRTKSRDRSTRYKSQIALATLYYNDNKFKQAIPLFESSLSKIQDRFWTKDSFNLAWSYYREGRYDSAIRKLKQVYKRSSNPKMIDMRDAVARDIGLFYATAGKIEQGLVFYKSIGVNYARHLQQLGENLSAEGKYTQAEKVLEASLKAEKDPSQQARTIASMLDLYEKFGRQRAHHLRTKQLLALVKRGHGDSEIKTKLRYHAAKMAAVLQKQVAAKTYVRLPKKRKRKAIYAVSYFSMYSEIDPSKRAENLFLSGETSYSIGRYPQALLFYNNSYELAKRQKNRAIQSKSIESMLAVLNARGLSSSDKNKYLVPIYEKYLDFSPKGAKAKTIYQRLFKTYFERKQFQKAYETLQRFAKAYPKDYKTQEAMLAPLMEYYRRKKDDEKMTILVAAIQAGTFSVSPKYASKVGELLTSIQMTQVQKALQGGKKATALKGYIKIYNDPKSTAEAKRNAAYNLSVLYYEVGSSSGAYKWAIIALGAMTLKELLSFEDSFLTITSYLFEKLQFNQSMALSYKFLQKSCRSSKAKNDQFFRNGSFLAIAQKDLEQLQRFQSLASKCRVSQSVRDEVAFQSLGLLLAKKQWEDLNRTISSLEKQNGYPEKLIPYLHELRIAYKDYGNDSLASQMLSKINSFYRSAKRAGKNIPLESLNIVASYRLVEIKKQLQRLNSIVLAFPENNFNQLLEQKLAVLKTMTNMASDTLQTGSGVGIIGTYALLSDAYAQTAKEIAKFRPPKGPEYVKSFQQSMAQVSAPLYARSQEFKQTALTQMERDEVLTDLNSLLKTPEGFPFAIQYPVQRSVFMDRGGRR